MEFCLIFSETTDERRPAQSTARDCIPTSESSQHWNYVTIRFYSEWGELWWHWIRYRKLQGKMENIIINSLALSGLTYSENSILALWAISHYLYSLEDNYAMRRLKEVLLSQVVLNTLFQSASSYLDQEMRDIDTEERMGRPPRSLPLRYRVRHKLRHPRNK